MTFSACLPRCLLGAALLPALAAAPQARAEGPDLTGLVPVLDERFTGPLALYDGVRGLWSTLPRRNVLNTNAPEAVFLNRGIFAADDPAALDAPMSVTADGLAIHSDLIPEAALPGVRDYMRRSGQEKVADDIRYYTGQISTTQTWSQTYGYFEVTAKIPRGKGRWPAFWLTHAGLGWPPEIDVFEAYGKGVAAQTPKDDTFNAAVFFDDVDADGNKTLPVDITNPYEMVEGAPEQPDIRGPETAERRVFHRITQAMDTFGADIYDGFWTYGALWTPESVTFYFGPDREHLQQIYRAPTPADVNEPMYLIANDQISMRGGFWSPVPEEAATTLGPQNPFTIRQITVMALPPEEAVQMDGPFLGRSDTARRISDTGGDDVIELGDAADMITLSGGADTLRVPHGRHGTIVSGFGPDDRLVLEGFPIADGEDALRRLTQVGGDVWLPAGAYPDYPQTIVFKDSQIGDFAAAQFTSLWPQTPDVWNADATRDIRAERDDDGDGVISAVPGGSRMNDAGKPVEMRGGPGGDIFMVASGRTRIVAATGDNGIDTLEARVNMRLPDFIRTGIVTKDAIQLTAHDGGARLVSEAQNAVLRGGAGDDLFEILPEASAVIDLGAAGGNDRLRGFTANTSLRIPCTAGCDRSTWQVVQRGPDALVTLGPDRSLLVEDSDAATVEAALPAP